MTAPIVISNIDDYLKTVPVDVRKHLVEIRRAVKLAIPDATETMSYKMPAFRQRKVFFYFAAFKKHIGVYPPVNHDEKLVARTSKYRGPKGNLTFKLSEPIPIDLIRDVALALSNEYRGE